MSNMADGLNMNPRPGEPESAMTPGMAAPAPRSLTDRLFKIGALGMPDTSGPGPTALQAPTSWAYDFDPANGSARATFNGEITYVGAGGPGVTSFNTRAGAVTLTSADITGAGGALASASVSSFNTRTGAVTLTTADITGAGGAAQSSLANYLPLAGGTVTGGTSMTNGLTVSGGGTAALVVNGAAAIGPSTVQSTFNSLGDLVVGGPVVSIATAGSQLSLYGNCNHYSDASMMAIGESGDGTTPNWRRVFTKSSGLRTWYDAAGNSMMALVNGGNLTIQGTLTQSSDVRSKRDIEDCAAGIEEVRLMQPRSYQRVHAPPPADHPGWAVKERTELGFVAQEMQEALPEAVHEDDNGGLSVALMPLIAALTNAVKTLDARLAALEAMG